MIQEKATRKDWLGLAVLVIPILLVSMDVTVLFLALPKIAADLQPSSSQVLWILDMYGFVLAGLLITMGAIGDRIGRRRLLLAGATTFGIASVIAAFSTSAEMLIAARFLLGIGGATLAPSTLSLIRNMFHDEKERRSAIGYWTAGFAGGAALGPVIGGFLLENFEWGTVFLINVPVMISLLVLGPRLLPEFRDPNPGKFDPASVLLSMAGLLLITYGIKHGAEHGIDLMMTWTLLLGAVLTTTFVLRQIRLPNPLIDVDLFRSSRFSTSIAIFTLAIFSLVGFSLFSSQYLQQVVGLGPLRAGLWSLIPGVFAAVGSIIAPSLSQRFSVGSVITSGLILIGTGSVILTFLQVDSGLPLLLFGQSILFVGISGVAALASDLVLSQAPKERAGAASALSETGAELGGAPGIALLGSLGAWVYRDQLTNGMPAELPPEVRDTALDGIGNAIAIAPTLPEPIAESLRSISQSAFV
ncbi:MAG: MFS transporter, partial [Thermomicrobiales bacterium]